MNNRRAVKGTETSSLKVIVAPISDDDGNCSGDFDGDGDSEPNSNGDGDDDDSADITEEGLDNDDIDVVGVQVCVTSSSGLRVGMLTVGLLLPLTIESVGEEEGVLVELKVAGTLALVEESEIIVVEDIEADAPIERELVGV